MMKSCCATYETHGLLPFIPYQMLNCLPPMVTVPFGIGGADRLVAWASR